MIDNEKNPSEKDGVHGNNVPEEDVRPDDRDTSKEKSKPDPAGTEQKPSE